MLFTSSCSSKPVELWRPWSTTIKLCYRRRNARRAVLVEMHCQQLHNVGVSCTRNRSNGIKGLQSTDVENTMRAKPQRLNCHRCDPSTSFVDNTIDLPLAKFSKSRIPEGSSLIFGYAGISLKHRARIGGRKLPCQNSSIRSSISIELRLMTDTDGRT